ncbi:MAG TPA: acyltransferase [Flavobacteriales bacterium]
MSSKSNQLPIINTLRAIAALMVCVFHFSWHSDETGMLYPEDNFIRYYGWQGHIGVYVFFVISGFVIPLSMWYGRYHLRDFFRFIAKRLVRLHPPFVLTLVVMALLAVCYSWVDGTLLVIDVKRILHNFFLTAEFFDVQWYQGIYWTLAIEFQYYLLIGLLFPLFSWKPSWISVLFFIPFLLSAHFFDHQTGKHIIFFHAPVFAMGIALFLHHIKHINGAALVLIMACCMVETRYELSPEIAVATSITSYAIACMNWHNRVLDFVGKVSYSLYLTHGISGGTFLYATARYAESFVAKTVLLVLTLLVSIAGAWIFYKIIEEPSIRWSKRIRYKWRDGKREKPE